MWSAENPTGNGRILVMRLFAQTWVQTNWVWRQSTTSTCSMFPPGRLLTICPKNSGNVMLAIREAAASGESTIFESGQTYDISENDIPFAQRTEFNGPDGGYVNFNITNPVGTYGTFDLRTSNSLGGGRFNRFRNLRFRYPNQVKALTDTITAPVTYPPIFHRWCVRIPI
ncbi:Uncharacterised protein [Klebsiella michiganensis]|nr:Uncharacterised protein [Klebsiella michiganensis]